MDYRLLCLPYCCSKKCTYHFTGYVECSVCMSCSFLILIGCQCVCHGCIGSATDLWVSVTTGVPSSKHLLPLFYNTDLSRGQWGKLASSQVALNTCCTKHCYTILIAGMYTLGEMKGESTGVQKKKVLSLYIM